ncbi:PilZ domain-containing protein [Myxococcota bacterium]
MGVWQVVRRIFEREKATPADRRQYPRVSAPIYSRPARVRMTPLPVSDVGLGGMRVYSDEETKVGQRLEVDVVLADRSTATCVVQVAWVAPLKDGPAKYDLGLMFVSVPPGFLHQLRGLID